MRDEELLKRIVADSQVMLGKPVIKGTRLTVEYVLKMLAHGGGIAEIQEEYEDVTEADIRACLLFAQKSLESTTFLPLAA